MNFKEELEKLTKQLSFQIVEGAKTNILNLIGFLVNYQEKCWRGEVVVTQNVGSFEVTVEERGIDWRLLEESINQIPNINEDSKGWGELEEEEQETEEIGEA